MEMAELQENNMRLNRPNENRMSSHESANSNTLVQTSGAHASTHHADVVHDDDVSPKTGFKTSNMFWLLLAFLFSLIILGAS